MSVIKTNCSGSHIGNRSIDTSGPYCIMGRYRNKMDVFLNPLDPTPDNTLGGKDSDHFGATQAHTGLAGKRLNYVIANPNHRFLDWIYGRKNYFLPAP